MAFLFVCTQEREDIWAYGIYGRNMSSVIFEDTVLGVALWHDPCSDMSEYCLIQAVPSRIYLREESKRWKSNGLEKNCRREGSPLAVFCPHCESRYGALCARCYEEVKANRMEDFILIYEPAYVPVKIARRTHILFPSDLAFYVFREITNSRTFRRRFCRYVRRKYSFLDMTQVICECEEIHKLSEFIFPLPYVIVIQVELAISRVCLAWCYRAESLLKKRVILEDTMAWLSTLGGAYSSLGDYFMTHSKMAGHISVAQLRISLEMGDPVMAAKCRLFFALSLMQRGALKKSKDIIRKEYTFAKSQKDKSLNNMCHGLWSKLKFYHSVKKSKQCAILSSHGNRNKKEVEYMDFVKAR